MYAVTDGDRATPYSGIPTPDVGAPSPLVLSNDFTVAVAFRTSDSSTAIARFRGFSAYLFGEPNDEALAGHPLADRGLEPYGSYLVSGSSWIAALERQNSVHPSHDPSRYAKLKHFIIAFHDSTFECAAESAEVSIHRFEFEAIWPELQAAIMARVV